MGLGYVGAGFGTKKANFAADISTFAGKTGLKADKILRKLALDAYAGLLKRSPVDTGRFRASWRIGIDKVDLTTEPARDEQGLIGVGLGAKVAKDPTSGMKASLATVKFGQTIFLSNNLPYAGALEEGHSQQAPTGVLINTYNDILASLRKSVDSLKNVP